MLEKVRAEEARAAICLRCLQIRRYVGYLGSWPKNLLLALPSPDCRSDCTG